MNVWRERKKERENKSFLKYGKVKNVTRSKVKSKRGMGCLFGRWQLETTRCMYMCAGSVGCWGKVWSLFSAWFIILGLSQHWEVSDVYFKLSPFFAYEASVVHIYFCNLWTGQALPPSQYSPICYTPPPGVLQVCWELGKQPRICTGRSIFRLSKPTLQQSLDWRGGAVPSDPELLYSTSRNLTAGRWLLCLTLPLTLGTRRSHSSAIFSWWDLLTGTSSETFLYTLLP